MLDIIKEAGMKSYGLEYSSKSISFAKKLKRNVIKGFLTEMDKIKNGPFSGFVCFNFLEHIPNPKLFISNIYTTRLALI